jgi:hypothetical protein
MLVPPQIPRLAALGQDLEMRRVCHRGCLLYVFSASDNGVSVALSASTV